MLDRVKFLPTPYVIYTQLRTHLSAQTTTSERCKFAHCLPYDEPISFHEIFKTLYYLPIVPSAHMERIRRVAKFIWKLGKNKKNLNFRHTDAEKRYLPRPYVIFSNLRTNLSSSIAPLDRIKFAKCFRYKKPITYDKLLHKLYYTSKINTAMLDQIEMIAKFIWRLGTTDKNSRLKSSHESYDSESLSDHYFDEDLCPSPPENEAGTRSVYNPADAFITGVALVQIQHGGFKTKYQRRKYTSYNSISEKSMDVATSLISSGSGTPLGWEGVFFMELAAQRALELVEKRGRPTFKKLLEYTKKKKARLLENFFNMETS